MPVAQLPCRGSAGVVFVTCQYFAKQIRIYGVDVAVHPDRFYLMVAETRVATVERSNPSIERASDVRGPAFAKFTLGPVTISILRPFQNIQQSGDRRAGNPRWLLQLLSLGGNPPDTT